MNKYFAAKAAMPAPVKDTRAYNYQYATLSQVKEIVDKACAEHGIAYMQYQVAGMLMTKVVDAETGEEIVLDTRQLSDGNDQQRGSSETYQRRYALLTVFGLAPEDDDGKAASEPRRAPQNAPSAPDPLTEHKARLWAAVSAYAQQHGADPKALAEGCKKRSDYEETAKWYDLVAEEFESELE